MFIPQIKITYGLWEMLGLNQTNRHQNQKLLWDFLPSGLVSPSRSPSRSYLIIDETKMAGASVRPDHPVYDLAQLIRVFRTAIVRGCWGWSRMELDHRTDERKKATRKELRPMKPEKGHCAERAGRYAVLRNSRKSEKILPMTDAPG
ncbi:hypothetical protein PY730_27895 (plasmid) [Klebsiella pneumoniae]|nr:hypothetical protein PY730_27895 [Klebsiella pneumoniae]